MLSSKGRLTWDQNSFTGFLRLLFWLGKGNFPCPCHRIQQCPLPGSDCGNQTLLLSALSRDTLPCLQLQEWWWIKKPCIQRNSEQLRGYLTTTAPPPSLLTSCYHLSLHYFVLLRETYMQMMFYSILLWEYLTFSQLCLFVFMIIAKKWSFSDRLA